MDNLSGMMSQGGLLDAFRGIMSNPLAMQAVMSAIGGIGAAMPRAHTAPDVKPENTDPPIFTNDKQNQANIMDMMPQLVSVLGPLLSPGNQQIAQGAAADSVAASVQPAGGAAMDKREALIRSIMPYLSPSRRTAAEAIMQVTSITDLLQRS